MNRLQMMVNSFSPLINKTIESSAWDLLYGTVKDNVESVLNKPYSKSAIAYVCISTTAEAIGQVPILVMKKVGSPNQGMRRRAFLKVSDSWFIAQKTNHFEPTIAIEIKSSGELVQWEPVMDNHPWQALFNRPNYLMSMSAYTEALISNYMLDGNVWSVGYPSSPRTIPDAIWVTNKRTMEPKKNKQGHLIAWQYNPRGNTMFSTDSEMEKATIPIEDRICHIKMFNPDDPIMGLSPFEPAKMPLRTEWKAARFNEKVLDNDGTPGGSVMTDKFMAPPQVAEFRQQWREAHSGSDNAKNLAILHSGLKYQNIGVTMKSMEHMDLRKFTRDEIIQILKMKKAVISITEDLNYACIPASERVYTKNRGSVSIAEIKRGDIVWGFDTEERKLVSRNVLNCIKQGEKQIYKIKTKNRSLKASNDHPILTLRVEQEKLDKVPHKRNYGILEWKKMEELKINDYLVTLDYLPENNSISCYSTDFIKFLGFFIGDGSVTGSKHRTISLAIHENNEALREEYKRIAKQEFSYVRDCLKDKEYNISEIDTSILLQGNAYDRLRDSEILGTAYTKRIPSWIFTLSREKILAFLRGYGDSDGSMQKDGRLKISSVNRELIKDLKSLCEYIGIKTPNIYEYSSSTNFTDNYTLYSLTIADPFEIGSDDPKDIVRMKERSYGYSKAPIKKQYGVKIGMAYESLSDNFRVERVLGIELRDNEITYDLIVESPHNFICNGIVVHNTHQGQIKAWWQTGNIPKVQSIQTALSWQFLKNDPNLKIMYDLSVVDALQDDFKEKTEIARQYWSMGISFDAINERLGLGFDSGMPGADTGYLPFSLAPAGMPIEPPQETPPQLPDESEEEEEEKQRLLPPIEVKFVDITSEAERKFQAWERRAEPIWKIVSNRVGRIEKPFEGKVQKVFFELRKNLLSVFHTGKPKKSKGDIVIEKRLTEEAIRDINEYDAYREKLLLDQYAAGYFDLGITQGIDTILDELGTGDRIQMTDPFIVEYMRAKRTKITSVIDTVKHQIEHQMFLGAKEGEDVVKLEKRIKTMLNIANKRAHVIARTEMGGAMNFGRYAQINRTSFKYKIWFTALDERVRNEEDGDEFWHDQMHGERLEIGPNSKWAVPGKYGYDYIDYPGDYKGKAGNIINDRCIETVDTES